MRVSLTLSNSKKKPVEEGGQLQREIKTALNPQIKRARVKDLDLGVFVSYGARA
jgi:hypothetical protein